MPTVNDAESSNQIMVTVAQSVERKIVALDVACSIHVGYPIYPHSSKGYGSYEWYKLNFQRSGR